MTEHGLSAATVPPLADEHRRAFLAGETVGLEVWSVRRFSPLVGVGATPSLCAQIIHAITSFKVFETSSTI